MNKARIFLLFVVYISKLAFGTIGQDFRYSNQNIEYYQVAFSGSEKPYELLGILSNTLPIVFGIQAINAAIRIVGQGNDNFSISRDNKRLDFSGISNFPKSLNSLGIQYLERPYFEIWFLQCSNSGYVKSILQKKFENQSLSFWVFLGGPSAPLWYESSDIVNIGLFIKSNEMEKVRAGLKEIGPFLVKNAVANSKRLKYYFNGYEK